MFWKYYRKQAKSSANPQEFYQEAEELIVTNVPPEMKKASRGKGGDASTKSISQPPHNCSVRSVECARTVKPWFDTKREKKLTKKVCEIKQINTNYWKCTHGEWQRTEGLGSVQSCRTEAKKDKFQSQISKQKHGTMTVKVVQKKDISWRGS